MSRIRPMEARGMPNEERERVTDLRVERGEERRVGFKARLLDLRFKKLEIGVGQHL